MQEVRDRIFINEIWIPEDLYLFNPPAMLCKFLHRDYKSLCRDLGLSSLSDYDPNVGVGQFQMIPFRHFQSHIVPGLTWKDEERCWFIAAQTRTDRSSKKRKRNRDGSQSTMRMPVDIQGQHDATSGTFRADNRVAPSTHNPTTTYVDGMALVFEKELTQGGGIDLSSTPHVDGSFNGLIADFDWESLANIDTTLDLVGHSFSI